MNLGGGLSGSTLSPLYRFKAGFSSCIFSFTSVIVSAILKLIALLNILPLRDNIFLLITLIAMSLLNPWPSYTEEEIASVVSVLKNGKVNYLAVTLITL